MKIDWNAQIFRWYVEASEYTGYDRELKKILLNMIPEDTTLCDMGCGAGLIDMELADSLKDITCVDVNGSVIEEIKQEVLRRGITNLKAVCSDGLQMKGRWDTVMAIFHARNSDTVRYYLELARDRLILITRSSKMTKVGIGQYRELECYDRNTMPQQLLSMGLKFTQATCEIEHGQPFRNLKDAMSYLETFTGKQDPAGLKAYMEAELVETGETEFPYYLPKKKQFEVFCIRKGKEL